MFHEPAVNQQ